MKPKYPLAIVLALALVAVSWTAAFSAEELVVSSYGGSFADNTKTCRVAGFEKQTGAKVTVVVGTSVETLAKLRAQKGSPQIDVAYMDEVVAVQAKAEGLLEKMDYGKLSNFRDIYPSAVDKDGMMVAQMYAATILAYNPKVIRTQPTSWNDLWNPAYKGKIALSDITGTAGVQFLIAAAHLRGGALQNLDPGFKAIKELMPGVVNLYTHADQLVSLLERGDVVLAPWYHDRIGAAAAKGVPVAASYPKEGGVGILPMVQIVKGSKKLDLAHKYINYLLSEESQQCFAEKQFAGPVNRKVKLDPKLAEVVPYGPAIEKLYFPDVSYIAANRPAWTERWNKEIVR